MHELFVYTFTVDPASAVPLTFGELSFAGDVGDVDNELGFAGAVESSTNVTESVEHCEVFPAASVAVAKNVVELSAATETVKPGLLKFAAVPVAATELVHELFVYTFTVDPASAVPLTFGELSFAGDVGDVDNELGFAGAVESSTNVTESVEHCEVFPAASVAVAKNVVELSAATETVKPGLLKFAAVPVAATELVHELFVYTFTVDPASAVPLTFGELSFAGDVGDVDNELGFAGAVESSTNVTESVEHCEVFPAASVAVAKNVVELSAATETVKPGLLKFAAVPVAATELVHELFVYTFTVDPASAVPLTFGELSFAGDVGDVDNELGFAGAVESSTNVTESVEHADVFPA